jgi:hypothetical protein
VGPTGGYTGLGTAAYMFTIPSVASVIAYGFGGTGSAGGTPSELSARNFGSGNEESGLGLADDNFSIPNLMEIDNEHFVQLDVRELAKFANTLSGCSNPQITIGSVQMSNTTPEGFEIGGSFTVGNFGTTIYTLRNMSPGVPADQFTLNLFLPYTLAVPNTVFTFNPSSLPSYPYISVRAYPPGSVTGSGDVVIHTVSFSVCL